jgi:glycosyltransferase involved in cell wall biosynthesis
MLTVSAVIPTYHRPGLVVRAVRSVLKQTFRDLEVIVVVDGPDAAVSTALSEIQDDRLRVVELADNLGVAGARNIGIENAKGTWIAFLDDDDEWLPEKLDTQLAIARRSIDKSVIVASRFIARTPRGSYLWPQKEPSASQHLSEYLFCRKGLFQGEGLIGTSTLLAPAALLRAVPFRALKKHEDWDWLLRVTNMPDTRLEFCSRPLSICYMEQSRPSLSNTKEWRFSLDWIRGVHSYITPQAFAAFVLTVVAAQAANGEASFGELCKLLREAVRSGRPAVWDLALFAGLCTVPRDSRHRLRSFLSRTAITTAEVPCEK